MDIQNLLANIKLRELEFTDFAGLLFACIEPLSDSHKELAATFSVLDTENISAEARQIIAGYLVIPPNLEKSIQRLSRLSYQNKLSIYAKIYSILSVTPLNNVKEKILYKIRLGFRISKREDRRLRGDFGHMKKRFSIILYRAFPFLSGASRSKGSGVIATTAAILGLITNLALFTGSIGKITRIALFFVFGFFLGFWLDGWRAEQIRKESKIKAKTVINRLESMIDILNIKLEEIEEISHLAWYKEYYDAIKSKIKDLKDAKSFYQSLDETCA